MEIVMPRVGLTMTEGTIAQWHKREGDAVRKGDVLFTFETEKSTLEYESPADGTLTKILVSVGQTVACLTPVALVGEEVPHQQQRRITPRAKLRAREFGINLEQVEGTGPHDRVIERDVLKAATVAKSLIPNLQSLSVARRITAQRMADNTRTAPHVTLTTEADATELVSAREQLIAELGEKVSYNTLFIAICARALKEHPHLNASWVEDSSGILLHDTINIGLAVDTSSGLYVPVVHDVGTKSLTQIHRELNTVVARALEGKATPDDLGGGTFTITNLGMFEIDAFTPIVNLPEAAILGVGRIIAKPVAKGEQVVVRQMMALSLSFDHRVVDGAPAAKFLQRVKQLIERPFALLAW